MNLLYVTSVSQKESDYKQCEKIIFRKQSLKTEGSVVATLDHTEQKFARRSNVNDPAV